MGAMPSRIQASAVTRSPASHLHHTAEKLQHQLIKFFRLFQVGQVGGAVQDGVPGVWQARGHELGGGHQVYIVQVAHQHEHGHVDLTVVVRRCLALGASGYVLKESAAEELLGA